MNINKIIKCALRDDDKSRECLTILALLLEKDKATLITLHPETVYIELSEIMQKTVVYELYQYISKNPLPRLTSEIFWVMGKANPKIILPFLVQILKNYVSEMSDEEIYQILIALENCVPYIKQNNEQHLIKDTVKSILNEKGKSSNQKIADQASHIFETL